MNLIYFPIIVSLFGMVFVWYLSAQVKKPEVAPGATTEAKDTQKFYLKKKYKTTGIVGFILFILFLVLPGFSWKIAVGFLIGAFLAGLAKMVSTTVPAKANARILGLTIVNLVLLAISFCYLITAGNIQALVGLGLGTGFI